MQKFLQHEKDEREEFKLKAKIEERSRSSVTSWVSSRVVFVYTNYYVKTFHARYMHGEGIVCL
jgi:hypothetical protein